MDEDEDHHGFRYDEKTAAFRLNVLVGGSAYNGLQGLASEVGLPASEYASILLEKRALRYWERVFNDRAVPSSGGEVRARHRIKLAAARISRSLEGTEGVRPDHTLRVFREIRERHLEDYLLATRTASVSESGSRDKHALNLAIGAISKHAAGARVRTGPDGKRQLIRNIRGELCTTVTVLEPDEGEPEDFSTDGDF